MSRPTDDEDDKLSEDELRSIPRSQSSQEADPRYQAMLAFMAACEWPLDDVASIEIGPGGAVANIYARDDKGDLVLNPTNPRGQPLREHRSVLWGFRIPGAAPSQTTADITKDPKCLAFWQKPGVRGIRACSLTEGHEGEHEDSLGFRWSE